MGSKFVNKRTDFEVGGIVNIHVTLGYFPVGLRRILSGRKFWKWVLNNVGGRLCELGA